MNEFQFAEAVALADGPVALIAVAFLYTLHKRMTKLEAQLRLIRDALIANGTIKPAVGGLTHEPE